MFQIRVSRLTPELLSVPGRLARAVGEAGAILRAARADVAVGFGGYVSLPVYLAAARLRLPVVLHEQNAVPGLANKVAARFARVVAVSFPGTPLPRAEYVGLPLRKGIDPKAFGLIVLGSADPDRFQAGMGTAFLERIGETASAALSRLAE